jgi:hypothetical protein
MQEHKLIRRNYMDAILVVLDRLGGRASAKEVQSEVRKELDPYLTEIDLGSVPSDRRSRAGGTRLDGRANGCARKGSCFPSTSRGRERGLSPRGKEAARSAAPGFRSGLALVGDGRELRVPKTTTAPVH